MSCENKAGVQFSEEDYSSAIGHRHPYSVYLNAFQKVVVEVDTLGRKAGFGASFIGMFAALERAQKEIFPREAARHRSPRSA